MKTEINICPELAGFNKYFLKAMRTEARKQAKGIEDRENYLYSDLTFAYCCL